MSDFSTQAEKFVDELVDNIIENGDWLEDGKIVEDEIFDAIDMRLNDFVCLTLTPEITKRLQTRTEAY